jgi:hypothetical protein
MFKVVLKLLLIGIRAGALDFFINKIGVLTRGVKTER